MPAAAPFLTHSWILCAAEVGRGIVARHANVAADAFANVVDPSLLDLLREERISDRRPRCTDEIEHAALNLRNHRVGRGEAANADNRLCRQLLDEASILLLESFLGEARSLTVVGPVGNVDVPQVGQLSEHLDNGAGFAIVSETRRAH